MTSWVAEEVLAGGDFPDGAALKAAFAQPWLHTLTVAAEDADAWEGACRALINLHQIDMGEAGALVVAQQLAAQGGAALLPIDDPRGRQAALHSRGAILGTAGLPVLARQAGAIDAIRPLLLGLRQSGYFMSGRLIEAVLAQSGE